uniref:Uncharacterized protein n=1 Tax=Oryza rufipogon TaxID=4529 RepID=A0A0E0N8F7_ORYRU
MRDRDAGAATRVRLLLLARRERKAEAEEAAEQEQMLHRRRSCPHWLATDPRALTALLLPLLLLLPLPLVPFLPWLSSEKAPAVELLARGSGGGGGAESSSSTGVAVQLAMVLLDEELRYIMVHQTVQLDPTGIFSLRRLSLGSMDDGSAGG